MPQCISHYTFKSMYFPLVTLPQGINNMSISNVIDIKGRMLNLSAPQSPWPTYVGLICSGTRCNLVSGQRVGVKLVLDTARPACERISQNNRLELCSGVLGGVDRAVDSHRDARANSSEAMTSHEDDRVVWTPASAGKLFGQCSAKTRVADEHVLGVAFFIVRHDIEDRHVLS